MLTSSFLLLPLGYGPCETTNICTVSCDTGMSTPLRNIGPPLKNTSVFVMLNEDDCCLSPRGAVGEFCFGGDQVVSLLHEETPNYDTNFHPGTRLPQQA